MTVVPTIVLSAAVVKKSEEPNHGGIGSGTCGKQKTVALDPPPVIGTVDGVTRRVKLAGDELPEVVKVVVHLPEVQANA
jgi:hypothetical protein